LNDAKKAIRLFVKAVEIQLVVDVQKNQNAACEPDGQAKDVDERIGFELAEISEGDEEIISEHANLSCRRVKSQGRKAKGEGRRANGNAPIAFRPSPIAIHPALVLQRVNPAIVGSGFYSYLKESTPRVGISSLRIIHSEEIQPDSPAPL
jgi:hypothetical protein